MSMTNYLSNKTHFGLIKIFSDIDITNLQISLYYFKFINFAIIALNTLALNIHAAQ